MSVEFEEINKQREANDENLVMVDFTDEEGYGKYLDLHECYNKYLNIKGNVYVLDATQQLPYHIYCDAFCVSEVLKLVQW